MNAHLFRLIRWGRAIVIGILAGIIAASAPGWTTNAEPDNKRVLENVQLRPVRENEWPPFSSWLWSPSCQ